MKKILLFVVLTLVCATTTVSVSSCSSNKANTASTTSHKFEIVNGPSSERYISWRGKRVKVNEASPNVSMLWMILGSAFGEFVVVGDNKTQIALDGFGNAMFEKSDFILVN